MSHEITILAIPLPPIPHTEKVVTGLQYHSQYSRSPPCMAKDSHYTTIPSHQLLMILPFDEGRKLF